MANLRVITRDQTAATSPYRLVDARGNEIEQVNSFLDATALRGLSRRTLRTYAFALLSIWTWITKSALVLEALTEPQLADYIRYLREEVSKKSLPAPRSINLRLVITRSLYRFHRGCDLPRGSTTSSEPPALFSRPVGVRSCATRRMGRPLLRVKVPRRLIVPLKRDEVLQLFESFQTYRDLAIAGLMLFCGLRSIEILLLRLSDVGLLQEELHVLGKGNKDRVLPLPSYARKALLAYLQRERPKSQHDFLFVNLKGPSRCRPMTAVGIRELFRYHRRRSGVALANPHRFRHTFASDMVREGMPLPVLMRLMGHTSIEMTLRYANLSAEDVREEFERALNRINRQWPDGLPRNP